MKVREWDPKTAPAAELESLTTTLNEVFAVDLPGDPAWDGGAMRAYLTETMPGERRLCWLADAGPADHRVLGHANLLLMGDIGVVEVVVHPAARRHGLGRELVAEVARRAYSAGLSSLGVEAIGGTPAVKFWETLGFQCAYVEKRNILELAGVDWSKMDELAVAVPAGYHLQYHPGGLPKDLLEAYSAAKATRRDNGDAPPSDLDLRPSSYDALRLHESLATLNRRGMKPYLVLAVHEETGAVAALTEVVVPAQHPTRADQYDTIVVSAYRGLGLERAIKARMLCELRAAQPELVEVQTWNALADDPIAGVNAEFGFRPDREWREYEAETIDLVERLGR